MHVLEQLETIDSTPAYYSSDLSLTQYEPLLAYTSCVSVRALVYMFPSSLDIALAR